ncbi:MAG: hypothetical protein V1668_03435 [Patescibacteria group bacterium]
MKDSIEKLINDCMEIKFMKVKAEQLYSDLLPCFRDKKNRAVIQGIITDNHYHAQIAQQTIDLLRAPE